MGTGSRLNLQPTLAHHALASIGEKGLIGNWVQQNHDRLAQKAGFPQAKINEIHGAWGDMKNQVKMMDDTLRPDLLNWLEAWADRARMCVALGTSLCGMNADQVPRQVAERFAIIRRRPCHHRLTADWLRRRCKLEDLGPFRRHYAVGSERVRL